MEEHMNFYEVLIHMLLLGPIHVKNHPLLSGAYFKCHFYASMFDFTSQDHYLCRQQYYDMANKISEFLSVCAKSGFTKCNGMSSAIGCTFQSNHSYYKLIASIQLQTVVYSEISVNLILQKNRLPLNELISTVSFALTTRPFSLFFDVKKTDFAPVVLVQLAAVARCWCCWLTCHNKQGVRQHSTENYWMKNKWTH